MRQRNSCEICESHVMMRWSVQDHCCGKMKSNECLCLRMFTPTRLFERNGTHLWIRSPQKTCLKNIAHCCKFPNKNRSCFWRCTFQVHPGTKSPISFADIYWPTNCHRCQLMSFLPWLCALGCLFAWWINGPSKVVIV